MAAPAYQLCSRRALRVLDAKRHVADHAAKALLGASFKVTASSGSENVTATTFIQGLVDQIDFSSGVAMPRVDGQTVTVDRIVQIIEPEAE